MRNFRKLFLSTFSILTLALFMFQMPALSKAYYPTAKEMIQRADCIAYVKIESCEAKQTKGSSYSYQQESIATVKRFIKGTAPSKLAILGAETFDCANCHFPVGESIVFLRKQGDAYVGVGWNIANLPVTNGKVSWFRNLEDRRSDVQMDITKVISQIKKEMIEGTK